MTDYARRSILPAAAGDLTPRAGASARPVHETVVVAPPRAGSDEGAHLGDYLAVLARRWRLIPLFIVGAALVGALACVLVRPLYTSTAVVHVLNTPPQVTTEIQQVVAAPNSFEGLEFFQDQVQLLLSRALAALTIRELSLEGDPEFTGRGESPGPLALVRWRISSWLLALNQRLAGLQGRTRTEPRARSGATESLVPGVPPELIGRYMSWLQVEPVANKRMIRVSFTTPYPELSHRLAAGHVEQYIRRSLRSKFELTGEARQFLQSEIKRVEGELTAAEQALNEFQRTNNVVLLDEKENAVVERLTDLARRLTEAEVGRISAEAEYQLVKNREYDSLPAVIANPLIQTLKGEVTRLELRYAEQSQFFLSGSPQLQETTSQLKQARARLEREIGRVVGGIESTFLAAQAREASLRAELARQQDEVLDLKEITGQYIRLNQAVLANRGLYSTLLKRLQETEVVKGAQLSNAEVVDAAELPTGASYPNIPVTLAFSLVLGAGLGVGLIFVLEFLDTSVRTPDDVRNALDLPTLGVVPRFPSTGSGPEKPRILLPTWPTRARDGAVAPNPEVVTLVRERSLPAEAYRGIRTSLLFSGTSQPPRVVLFTSSQAGEGKTATSVNVAISLAQLGNRVILVDADLRKPRCHTALGVQPRGGLTEVLYKHVALGDVVQRIRLADGELSGASGPLEPGRAIDFLQSGSVPVDPATLISSPRMREMLRTLAGSYDMVVIDSPPIFPIADAAILATMVDGVVLVVRGHRTEQQLTREALARLRFMNAHVIGVVLNDVDPKSRDYTRRYSHYFSS